MKNGNPAGQTISFMLQAKDIGAKLRTTGLDPIEMTIARPEGVKAGAELVVPAADILDLDDGT